MGHGRQRLGRIHGVRIFTNLMFECAKRDPDYEGHIVNTASMAGFCRPPLSSIYDTTKHAVVAISECLYQDLLLVNVLSTLPSFARILCRQVLVNQRAIDQPIYLLVN